MFPDTRSLAMKRTPRQPKHRQVADNRRWQWPSWAPGNVWVVRQHELAQPNLRRWSVWPKLGVASNMIFQTKRGHNLINHFKHYKPGTWLFPSAGWSRAEAMQDSALYIINVWYIMILFQPALDQQTSVDQVGGHSLKITKHIKTVFF